MEKTEELELNSMHSFALELLEIPPFPLDLKFHPKLPIKEANFDGEKKRNTLKVLVPSRDGQPGKKGDIMIQSPTFPQARVLNSAKQTKSADVIARKSKQKVIVPSLKSVTMVEKERSKALYLIKKRSGHGKTAEQKALGYSNDSVLIGGEVVLTDLYYRSKKLQTQSKRKGFKPVTVSPRASGQPSSSLAQLRLQTAKYKGQLTALGEKWGIAFSWSQSLADSSEQDLFRGKLAKVSHRIGQETLRVLGNR